MEKFYLSKTLLKMAGGGGCIPSPGSATDPFVTACSICTGCFMTSPFLIAILRFRPEFLNLGVAKVFAGGS